MLADILNNPSLIISRVITLIIAFTIHELAHAWSADQLGDNTPRAMGRLTLNPLAHLDPIGSLLLLVAGFGWAKPVPVNPNNLRGNPRIGFVLVAAAGPFSNLVMALCAAIPFRLEVLSLADVYSTINNSIVPTPANFLLNFIIINISLMLFNLIPVPPLDGSKILAGFAPREWEPILRQLDQYGPILLMVLFFIGGGILGAILNPPIRLLLGLMLGY